MPPVTRTFIGSPTSEECRDLMAQGRAVHLRFVTVVFWKPTFEDGRDAVRAHGSDLGSHQIRRYAKRRFSIDHHNQNLGSLGTAAHCGNFASEGSR